MGIIHENMYNLGTICGEMLKFEKAIVLHKLALYCNNYCAEACNNLGSNLQGQRQSWQKWWSVTRLLHQLNQIFHQSLNNLGVVYTVQGKMDATASMIEKAIVTNPTCSLLMCLRQYLVLL
jgi:protein O-GlcNAc transferase